MDLKSGMYPLNFWSMFGFPNANSFGNMNTFLPPSSGQMLGHPRPPASLFLGPTGISGGPHGLDAYPGGTPPGLPRPGMSGLDHLGPGTFLRPPTFFPHALPPHSPGFLRAGLGQSPPATTPFLHGSTQGQSPVASPKVDPLQEAHRRSVEERRVISGKTAMSPGYQENKRNSPPVLKRACIDLANFKCPVCYVVVKESDLDFHLAAELCALKEGSTIFHPDKKGDQEDPKEIDGTLEDINERKGTMLHPSSSRYHNFLKIRNNRIRRNSSKFRKRKLTQENFWSPASSDQAEQHEKQFEEYETDVQVELHTNQGKQLPDTLTHLPPKRRKEEDVEVVDDDMIQYGDRQFSEDIPIEEGEGSEVSPTDTNEWREADSRLSPEHHKCCVCKGEYRRPLVSVDCWHVHCEECWLKSLTTKKLCPQCQSITTVNALRKVFL